MSKIVLGIGTSHSPLLAMDAELWVQRGLDDRRNKELCLTDGRTVDYDTLYAEVGERYADVATLDVFKDKAKRAQAALDRLAQEVNDAAPDVVIIVGDDQEELFGVHNMPAVAVSYGDQMAMYPKNQNSPNLPEWLKIANVGYGMDTPKSYKAAPDFALRLIEGLLDASVDVAAVGDVPDPNKAGFGHAFGFVVERLFSGRAIPVVPVLLNTYYPPSVARAWRAYEIGHALATAIEAMPDDTRVAIVASGGLSHFVADEDLDRTVLDALKNKDPAPLRALPPKALRSGSSEILNWVLTGGALEAVPLKWMEYIPVQRTPAGTGIGLGFAAWGQ